MARYKKMVEREDGWCDWQIPLHEGYKMACCDCGLVHDMEFTVLRVGETQPNGTFTIIEEDVPGMRVAMRARRNNRSTGQTRRHKPRD